MKRIEQESAITPIAQHATTEQVRLSEAALPSTTPNNQRPPPPPHSVAALGTQVQQARQQAGKTQDELARLAKTNRTAVALLEQGRRAPKEDVLLRILNALGLQGSPLASLVEPEEQLRLHFEQCLSELVGRSLRLEHLDHEAVAVARAAIRDLFERDKTLEQAYDAFATVLVFYDVPRPNLGFFQHYLGVEAVSSLAKFEARIERFQRDALRLFATFSEAYTVLSSCDDLPEQLRPLQRRDDAGFRQREPWMAIERIPRERLADLGYISAARIRQEQESRQALVSFLTEIAAAIEAHAAPWRGLEAYSERKRRKMSSLLRDFGGTLTHDFLSPLFVPDPDELRREAMRLAPKKEDELARIAETQAIGERNLARYLTADHLDVYVATSMRSDADFASVNSFVEALFGHDEIRPLKLRYFNPTQSWIEDRVAKGLVEALMLRRADYTVYMAQKDDTFGKDSEASVALGQGKAVIVYVPCLRVPEVDLDTAAIGASSRDDLIRNLKKEVTADDVDDTADDQALMSQLIVARLNRAPDEALSRAAYVHWADFDLVGEAKREENESRRAAYRRWIDALIATEGNAQLPSELRGTLIGILTALATNFEKRAHTFRVIHPLALQVILSTGVLNGILVTRTVQSCAEVLAALIKNELQFMLAADENSCRLIEMTTRSTIRVISRNQLIVNAFASYYRDQPRR